MLVLCGLEIAILLAFALSGIISPGSCGINTTPFQLDPKFSTGGLFLGIVFAIFAFTGFEAVAPMAEESTNPRRNLPIAIVVSLVFMGAFYVFTTFGLAVGWGTNTFDSGFAGKDVGTFMDLAQRLWGGGWVLLLFAMLDSAFAVGIAATDACELPACPAAPRFRPYASARSCWSHTRPWRPVSAASSCGCRGCWRPGAWSA